MVPDFAPIIPGVTESAEGSETMQLLSMLSLKRMRNPKGFEKMMDSLQELFTPRQPTTDSDVPSDMPIGQALGGIMEQPTYGSGL